MTGGSVTADDCNEQGLRLIATAVRSTLRFLERPFANHP